MDLSDGLADAVRQLAEASGTGARIEAAALPVHPGVAAVLGDAEAVLGTALAGGEDYELLLAVPPRAGRRFAAAARLARLPVTRIGALTPAGAGLTLATRGRRSADSRGFRALSGPGRRRFRARPMIAGGCARLHPGFAFRGSIRCRVAYANRVPGAAPSSQAPRGPSRPDHRPGACKTGRPLSASPAFCPGALGHELWCCHAR